MSHADTRGRIKCLECEAPEGKSDPPADRFVVDSKGDPLPLCAGCAERRVEQGGLEYPISAFYDGDPHTTEHFDNSSTMELFEVDDYEGTRIKAKSPAGAPDLYGFVHLTDMR